MKILILSNSSGGLYNFKRELIDELIRPNSYIEDNNLGCNDVHVVIPDNKKADELKELGCNVSYVKLERRGRNPINDFKLFLAYYNIIRDKKPDVVLTFTIKPNIYGGIACSILGIPYIANITGLGVSIRNRNLITGFVEKLYSIGLKKADKLYFENSSDLQFFNDNIMKNDKSILLPGSGINLNRFKYKDYPKNDETIKFLTIGRIMKDKGSDELLNAASEIKSRYNNVEFYLAGICDEERYVSIIDEYDKRGIIHFLGRRNDVAELIGQSNAVIHPSYHEGLSNVLLEAGATGRPVIASDIPGCRETFINDVSGIAINAKDEKSLINGIEKFLQLPYKTKNEMGINANKLVSEKFNRNIVIKRYIYDLRRF